MIHPYLRTASVLYFIIEHASHDILDFPRIHAAEDLKFLILCLLPDRRWNQHLREAIEI